MNKKLNYITSSQLATFIMAAQIGIGILTLPSLLAKTVGHDGWISILITGIIFACASAAIALLLNRYEDKSILEINQLLYSKGIGFILNLIIVIYLFFAAAIGLRLFTEVINVSILKLTPGIIVAALLILPSIHMCWHGLKTICRFDRIIIFIMIVVIAFLALFLDKFRLTFLMPINQAGIGTIMDSIIISSFAFLGIELMAIVYPNIIDKKKVVKNIIFANAISTLFFICIVITLTAVFGEELLKYMVFPLFSIARAYKAPVLERLDLFFISTWLPAMGISMTAYYYCSLNCIEKLFRLQKRFLIHILFSAAVVLTSRIPRDLSDAYRYSDILNKSGIIVIAFFIFSLMFSYINKNGVSDR